MSDISIIFRRAVSWAAMAIPLGYVVLVVMLAWYAEFFPPH